MPTPEGAISVAIVCEAAIDRQTGIDLADRVICERLSWIEGYLATNREYRGLKRSDAFIAWSKQKELVRLTGIRRFHGHFGALRNEPADPDAIAAQRMLTILDQCNDRPDVVVLLRDSDGDLRRKSGLEQARSEPVWRFPIIIGLAHTKRECWALAGFEAKDDVERETLLQLRPELGFDACEHPEKLDAQQDRARRSAKRVLSQLTNNNRERERRCWTETSLDVLRKRGGGTGLTEYLIELEQKLVPLLGGTAK